MINGSRQSTSVPRTPLGGVEMVANWIHLRMLTTAMKEAHSDYQILVFQEELEI